MYNLTWKELVALFILYSVALVIIGATAATLILRR